jgi:hypothetical protein
MPHQHHHQHQIVDTYHMIDRYAERFNRFNNLEGIKKSVNNIINTAVDCILKQYGDRKNRYMVHCQSNGMGVVLLWGKSTKYRDGQNHAILVTILPLKARHNPRHDEILINL